MRFPRSCLLLLLFEMTFTAPFIGAATEKLQAQELAAAEGAKPQVSPATIEGAIDQLLAGRIDQTTSAVAVLVARDGEILYERAFGSADLERGLAATPESIFRIGSVTKQFTAAAILHLQEAGKLKISDPL